MKPSWTHLAVGLLLVGLAVAAAPKEDNKGKGIFAPLEKGQKVGLKETASGFEISVMAGVDLAHTIKEIGADYIVVEDVAGVTETRIPLFSIKAVKIVRLPKK